MIGKRPTNPNALLRIRTGAEETKRRSNGTEYTAPVAWDSGCVEIKSDGDWQPHPGFKTHEQGGHQSFHIELISNVVEYSLQSHLMNYAGRVPFCTRAHIGAGGIGVAMRRGKDGGRVAVECDPERCAFRRVHLATEGEKNEIKGQIKEQDEKAFPWIAGKCEACKPSVNLLFKLLLPDGDTPAHAPTEYCVFHSTSDMNHGRFYDTLYHLWRQTHGQLAGLRLKLVYEPFESRFNRTTAAWNLRVPEETDFSAQQMAAAQRRAVMNMDYDRLVASIDTKALALIGQEKQLSVVAREQGIDLAEFARQSLDDQADFADYNAEYIDPGSVDLLSSDPTLLKLAGRIKLSYPFVVRMPMKFGNDLYSAMEWMKGLADKGEIYVEDIWQEYSATLPGAVTVEPVTLPPAPPVTGTEPEPEDAEYEEVQEERSLEDMMKDARGGG